MTNEEKTKYQNLIDEAMSEGLFDKLKAKVGLGGDDPFEIIPKDQWESLAKHNRQLVEMLANTPGVRDAADLATDVLDQLSGAGSMEARKTQQQIRQAVRNKDKSALIRIIQGLQKEADRIRSVRTGIRKEVGESVEKIAQIISEDISENNGFILD